MKTLNNTVAVCGASGFIGGNISRHLENAGCTIVPIGRELLADDASQKLERTLDMCDTLICVTGTSIDHRWSKSYKKSLYESRVNVVGRLTQAMNNCNNVRTFISASAVGYYPSVGCYDETSVASGSDFLAGLCRAWEAEAHKAPERIRTIVTRFGVVLASEGGAFKQLARPAKWGVAAIPGSGRQSFSWISIDDLCRAMAFLIGSQLSGTFNLVAPQKLDMREAMGLIAKYYKALSTIRVPAFFLRVMRGESADFILRGQCVSPKRLLDNGFEFETPKLQDFLYGSAQPSDKF